MDIGQVIVLLLLAILMGANYLRHRDVLYPPVILAGTWTVILALFYANEETFYRLSGLFYIVVLVSVALFSIGALFSTKNLTFSREPLSGFHYDAKPTYDKLLFWIPVLGIIPFYLQARGIAAAGPFDAFYQNLRFGIVNAEDSTGGGIFGILAYLLPISHVAVLTQTILERYRTDGGRYVLSLIVALIYTLLSTSRISFLFLVLSVAGIFLMTRRWKPAKVAVALPALVVLVVIGIGLWLEREGMGATIAETLINVRELLVVYTLGSLPAFDQFINSHLELQWGESTFRTVYAVLSNLGFDVHVRPNHFEFTETPLPTNVYTLYRPYYADFALAGVFGIASLLGLLHGYLYRRATQGNLLFVAFYAISLFPLVLQFYQDRYFSMLSWWVQFGILLTLFFYRFRILPDERGTSSAVARGGA